MTFEKLGLIPSIVNALTSLEYLKPTPVQAKVIPVALEGKDVVATAQTGTGKTAAYALPLLQHLAKKAHKAESKRALRGLVLVQHVSLHRKCIRVFRAMVKSLVSRV